MRQGYFRFNNRGQAVIVVFALLILSFTIGIALFGLANMERRSALRQIDSLRARYLTEAGISYAKKVLQLDKKANRIDTLEDLMFSHFRGEDVDWDDDNIPQTRWIDVKDSQGNPFGRFSVRVLDETGKANINVAPRQMLESLSSGLGVDSARMDALLSKRPFNAIEEAGAILSADDFNRFKDYITVYSNDLEVDLEGKRRVYLNSASSRLILEAFLASGIKDAFQKAANLKDASDEDLSQTIFDKFYSGSIFPSSVSEVGGWVSQGGYYQAAKGSNPGTFNWSNLTTPDGEYYCFLYGSSDKDVVGEAYLDAQDKAEYVRSGEGLSQKVTVSAGSFSLSIKPAKDSVCRFSYVELVSLNLQEGLSRKTITGTEAVVINEIMVKSSREIIADNASYIDPGQMVEWTFGDIKSGAYYVKVKAISAGGIVGDVTVNGRMGDDLRDKDYLPVTVKVGSNGNLVVQVKNNTLEKASFKGIDIFQEPDAEYIEIINLSSDAIDLSGYSIEVYSAQGELVAGWPAQIPQGTTISSYQHLVLAVDNSDSSSTPSRLRNNDISFQGIWGFSATGLVFAENAGIIDKDFDLLPNTGASIILKNPGGERVDAVEYTGPRVADFVSLERADPSQKADVDNDGLFDGWNLSSHEKKATPGLINDNAGMDTVDEKSQEITEHTPNEVVVYNRRLNNFKEVMGLSGTGNWKKFTDNDIARMSELFSENAIETPLVNHYQAGEFRQVGNAFESLHKSDSGIWEFPEIPQGDYFMVIISNGTPFSNGKISVSLRLKPQEDFSSPSELTFSQCAAFYGRVELSDDPSTLQLKITNELEEKLNLKEIRLEPVYASAGRINVNTASKEVLGSLFADDNLVQLILDNRPIGVEQMRNLGRGETVLLGNGFVDFQSDITVKSDVYEIDSRGEYIPSEKNLAYQIIRTVVQRSK